MKNILVTGGAGFIGANFVHYWMNTYPQDSVTVLDALNYAGNLANLELVKSNPNFKFYRGNICNTHLVESLLKERCIDTLVHFAAESHVDRSINKPDVFIQTNVIGTHSLLKAAKKVWLDEEVNLGTHRFHHVSTDEVYGTLEPKDPAFSEATPYAPNSPYSASKAASDHLVRAYHHTYGLRITTSNCSNNYGPFQFPEKLFPLVITNILYDLPLLIYGDGLQVRDWLYVEDHARAIEKILQKGRIGECYNIGGVNEWTNIDIVKLICKLMNDQFSAFPKLVFQFPNAKMVASAKAENLITFTADRAGHDRRYAIDPEKSIKELDYRPVESFETGIIKTINWYLKNKKWWMRLLKH
ncbi:dTDP-glucose 4,6-dehydratase [Microbulbifer epialgicus]|uniref:dTDP-glucose 4,6-dehydratase n=1 Tax=Microbulbifer epialgicus TaxID=393907 RepID=A0ABV4P4W6_9GAMM